MRDEGRSDPRPVDLDGELGTAAPGDPEATDRQVSSMVDDVAALVQDGRNFLEAEIAFQKSRVVFAADRSKSALVAGLFAIIFIHLALVALVVGLLIAIAPLVTAWGATAIVAGLLLICALVMLVLMRNSAKEVSDAFAPEEKEADQ